MWYDIQSMNHFIDFVVSLILSPIFPVGGTFLPGISSEL